MFNEQFYPTPKSVIEQMGIDCYDKVVLEPSAGSGNIVDWLNENGARSVLACEQDERLRKILQGKCRLLQNNFFDVQPIDISHIELIVMNPPFNNADKHILHAWDIAPQGCEIIALCNSETISKSYYSGTRKQLERIIEDYGEALGMSNCFSDAERKTNVEVSCIRLFKPVLDSNFDFDGFYYTNDTEATGNGIVSYNEIRAVVNSYVAAVKCFDEFREIADKMNRLTKIKLPSPTAEEPDRMQDFSFGGGFSFNVSYDKNVYTKHDFAKELQRHCWQIIFKKMNIQKWVTTGVMKDINVFIEGRKNYPFTMKNVYRMIEIIVGTREQTMNRAIVEAIDKLTQYTHENRYSLPGWKTNAGHLLNKKFIVDWIVEYWSHSGYSVRWNGQYTKIEDLTKAICYVTGRNFDEITTIRDSISHIGKAGQMTNHWYEAEFFEYKFFKKGTMHIKFKNESDWLAINRAYGKAKGQVLPEDLNIAA